MSFMKCTIWVVIFALSVSQIEDVLQQTLVDVGLMKQRVSVNDFCYISAVPTWAKSFIGCAKQEIRNDNSKKIGRKIKLTDELKTTMGFKKTFLDRIYDSMNDGIEYVWKLIFPKDFKMPCLFGNCDMHKSVEAEKKKILMYDQKILKPAPKTDKTVKMEEKDKK